MRFFIVYFCCLCYSIVSLRDLSTMSKSNTIHLIENPEFVSQIGGLFEDLLSACFELKEPLTFTHSASYSQISDSLDFTDQYGNIIRWNSVMHRSNLLINQSNKIYFKFKNHFNFNFDIGYKELRISQKFFNNLTKTDVNEIVFKFRFFRADYRSNRDDVQADFYFDTNYTFISGRIIDGSVYPTEVTHSSNDFEKLLKCLNDYLMDRNPIIMENIPDYYDVTVLDFREQVVINKCTLAEMLLI